MKKRTILIMAALLAAALAGCGKKETPNIPDAQGTTTESPASDNGKTEGGAGNSQGAESQTPDPLAAVTDDGTKKTITYWHTFTEGARKDYIDKMVAEYMEEHPNVTINVEVYPWNVFTQKWTAGLAAGALPDVSSVNPDNLFAINQAGAVLPMNPLVEALGEDYFLKKPLENFTDGGTILGIPYYLHSYDCFLIGTL